MVKVLEKVGCGVHYNINQTCCGLTAYNAGYFDYAKEVGEKFIREFQNDIPIVIPSFSCANMIKSQYTQLFHNSVLHNECKLVQKNIFEFSEFLIKIMNVSDVGAKFHGVATYHDSCSALRFSDASGAARKLLEKVRGLELREMNEIEECCGFGGVFSLKHPDVATKMASRKVENAILTDADYLISSDMSCLMHLESYMNKQHRGMKVLHLADVLAAGY